MALGAATQGALKHPTRALAEFVSGTKYEDLPQSVVHEAKRLLLDIISNALGGYRTEIGAAAVGYVRSQGGKPECTLIGYGDKTSAVNAAYCNARTGDALDATDMLMNLAHIGCPTVASALALCEQRGASGRELIASIALGFEVGARLAVACGFPPPGGAHLPPRRMPAIEFAAAGAAAKALELTSDEMVHAFGITGANAPILGAARYHDAIILPTIKYADVGIMAVTGTAAALMAKHGLTAFDSILDGEEGLWKIRGTGYCDFELMVGDLGNEWYFPENSYKPWPSCRWTHHPATLFQQIIAEHGIKAEEIEKVLVQAQPPGTARRFQNKNPIGMVSCIFNHGHPLAMIALGIERGARWYSPEIMNDSQVVSFRRKVDVETKQMPPEAKGWSRQEQVTRMPTSVFVVTRGRTFEAHGDFAKGDPWTPETYFTDEELKAKFMSVARPADMASPQREDKLKRIVETVFQLERVSDVGLLTSLLAD